MSRSRSKKNPHQATIMTALVAVALATGGTIISSNVPVKGDITGGNAVTATLSGPTAVTKGQQVHYGLTVRNNTDVSVWATASVRVPYGFQYLGGDNNCVPRGDTVQCALGGPIGQHGFTDFVVNFQSRGAMCGQQAYQKATVAANDSVPHKYAVESNLLITNINCR